MDESTQTSTWLLNEIGVDKAVEKGMAKGKTKKPRPWAKLHPIKKMFRVFGVLARLALLLGILYFFICALGLLEDAFKLLGGRAAGETFRNSDLLSNPIAGLMIGVLATVLVQSSSTATSIVVAMVAAQVIPLNVAIPIIMGTNIGTSVTSTLVSMAQAGEREEFRRAFAGATVHDMFNWTSVIVLLPLEVATNYLYHLTRVIVESMNIQSENYKMEMLTAITKPFIQLIVEVNRDVITDIAMAPNVSAKSSVMKRYCKVTMTQRKVSVMRYDPVMVDCAGVQRDSPFYSSCTYRNLRDYADTSKMNVGFFVGWNDTDVVNSTLQRTRCNNLFAMTDFTDTTAGAILLVISIFVILSSLFGIVKILNSLLQGPVAKMIQKTMNADFPGKFAYFTGYVAILVGCGLTIIIQSSSVFTSTLTPLVGVGIVTVERMYPMTLGSNIGTCVTGILAAMSTRGNYLAQALQIALCHLFFNITAVLIFYPIPFMRFPINMAHTLGKITSKYRWFAGLYLIFMFLLLPCAVFALSYAGWIYLAIVGGPILLLFIIVNIINVLQVKRPNWLPRRLRSWDFLPLFCHSWAPYDNIISCTALRRRCPKFDEDDDDDDEENYGDKKVNENGKDNRDALLCKNEIIVAQPKGNGLAIV